MARYKGRYGSSALVPSLKRVGIKFRRLFAVARHLHAWKTNRKRNVFDHSAPLTSPFPSFVLNSSVRVVLLVKAFHALSRLLFCSPLSCVVPVALAFALSNIIEGRIENGNFHLVTCIFHLRIVLLIFSYIVNRSVSHYFAAFKIPLHMKSAESGWTQTNEA